MCALEPVRFDPVPPLPADGRGLLTAIEGWVWSPPMRALCAEFGGEFGRSGSILDDLTALEAFSSRWDYRGGAERGAADPVRFGEGREARVLAAVDALGLGRATVPTGTSCDHVLILGGLAPACFARCFGAARLVGDGPAGRPTSITALAAVRPLMDSEVEALRSFTEEPLASEYDALKAGVRAAFGHPRDGHLRVVAVPTARRGAARADSGETLEWFAKNSGRLTADQTVVLVTTSIYAPYQHAVGLRTLNLSSGVRVEIDGIHPTEMDPRLAPQFRAGHFLQEIHATIRALRLLVVQATG
jgi:hypothetical protein